jgi:hypothetical protein
LRMVVLCITALLMLSSYGAYCLGVMCTTLAF